MITAASVQAAAEALGIVRALGLPLEKFLEAMRGNASHSATLAMKMPKMTDSDFEPHFSIRHMLKDMQIANQLGLSHDLELGVTAAARDRLVEQVQQGHGEDDYSAVARKYLPDSGSARREEVESGTQNVEAHAGEFVLAPEPAASSADLKGPKPQQNGNAAIGEGTMATSPGEKAEEGTRSRHGILSRFLRRSKQLLKRTTPSEEA
jgi:hypothetical protein